MVTSCSCTDLLMRQETSVTFGGPSTAQGPADLVKQDTVTKDIFQYARQQKVAEIPDAILDAVIDASKADVNSAWAQLVANMQHVLERLENDRSNQEIYAQLRQLTAIAVSPLLTAANHDTATCEAAFAKAGQNATFVAASTHPYLHAYLRACRPI